MYTYLKNMAGFTHSQLKNKSFDEVQKAFDKTMGWIDSFVSMDSQVVKGGKEKDEGNVTRAEESSSKRAGTELKQEKIKKQKIDDDQEEAKMKKHIEIVVDEEEIAVDVIPLATKPPIIVDWKIIKEGNMGYFQLIRADRSSRRNTRPEEAYERVLRGDLKVMFEPNIESDKKYLLTPATLTAMLNKKLQADHWNEMCYQLLKLMTKQDSKYLGTSFGFHPIQFSYPTRILTMEEMLYKFINEGRREHEEIGAFIREFKTTNELLLKERNNSLIELKFEVYGLSKAINDAQLSNYEVKGVTTRGGKTTTETTHDTNVIDKEPLILHHDKPIEPNEVHIKPQEMKEQIVKPLTPLIPFPHRLKKEKEEAQQ
ncbi:hypothetical protein Tco_0317245 [Tanacetum coccineum]